MFLTKINDLCIVLDGGSHRDRKCHIKLHRETYHI